MKKKLIAAVVSLTMAVTMFPSLAFAEAASEPVGSEIATQQSEEGAEAQKLAAAKKVAKDELDYYWGDGDAKRTDYDDEGRAAIDEIRAAGNQAIDEAGTEIAVGEALDEAKEQIDAVKTKKEKFDAAKSDAADELNTYWGTNGEIPAVQEDYDTTVQSEITTLRSEALNDINDLEYDGSDVTAASVIAIWETAKADIDAKDTIAEHKAAVKEQIDAYFPEGVNGLSDYDPEEQEAVTNAKNAAKTNVDADTVNADMDAEYGELKATVDKIDTTAAKALKSAKETAVQELDDYFPEDVTGLSDYATDQQTAVGEARTAGGSAINSAQTIDAVEQALADAKAAIDAIPTSAALTEQTTSLTDKITAIGTVTILNYNDKYDAIVEAEGLYTQLNAAGVDDGSISNLDALKAARTAYDEFKCTEVASLIGALGTIDADTYISKKADLERAEAEYEKIKNANSISTEKNALDTARTAYDEAAAAVTTFEETVDTDLGSLDPVVYANKATVGGVTTAYGKLSAAQKSQISSEAMAVYNAAVAVIEDFDDAIAHVEELIDNLPDPITASTEDKAALDAARSAYADLLDTDAQGAVTGFGDLQAAEADYVDALIDAIGTIDPITNAVITSTEAARKALDELTALDSVAAGMVTNEATLTTAEDAIQAYRDAIGQAAYNEAEEAFKAVENVTEVTADNVGAVEAAIEAYNQLHIADADTAEKAFKTRYDELGTWMQAYADQKAAEEKEKADTLKLMYASLTVADQIYTGKAIEPAVSIKDKAGNAVTADNYDLFFKNNENTGTATVTAVAKNDSTYTGSITASFKITARSISAASVSGIGNVTYTGKAITQPVSVAVAGRTLAAGTDYTVAYAANKAVGQATVTITAKGNYTGSITKTFIIKPAKGSIKSLKAGKKKMTVKVNGQSGAKYQIAYKVKGAKKYKTVKTDNTSKTIKKLKKGKTYIVKARAYKSISGTTYYGAYSKTKKVKVK